MARGETRGTGREARREDYQSVGELTTSRRDRGTSRDDARVRGASVRARTEVYFLFVCISRITAARCAAMVLFANETFSKANVNNSSAGLIGEGVLEVNHDVW